MTDPCGWILLDKPEGLSSAQALNRVKRALNVRKAGHAGTLDPAASGLLLIALGEACKFLSFLDFATKRYHFELHWGSSTTTDDGEGNVCATSEQHPDHDQITQGLAYFRSAYPQSPPAFSALKISGQRAYKRARAGNITRLPPRMVSVHDFSILAHHTDKGYSQLEVCFGKGGYVRAIGRDLAEHLGSLGHVRHIRRTQIGDLRIDQAISLASFDDISDNAHGGGAGRVLALESVLDGIPALDLTPVARQRLSFGQRCALDEEHLARASCVLSLSPDPQQVYLLRDAGCVFGLGSIEADRVRPKRLLRSATIPKPIPGAAP
ncbi:MAG: tRNA pseudouridine(55) synthase TruB [Alphaproteobacteria bacterium]|nr:tRNA pseudouridine(55) synthase TruB [Alphaproteobacteria bacterium]